MVLYDPAGKTGFGRQLPRTVDVAGIDALGALFNDLERFVRVQANRLNSRPDLAGAWKLDRPCINGAIACLDTVERYGRRLQAGLVNLPEIKQRGTEIDIREMDLEVARFYGAIWELQRTA